MPFLETDWDGLVAYWKDPMAQPRILLFLLVGGFGGFLNNLTSQGLLVTIGALGYQVLTRAKMMTLILLSWLFLGETLTIQKVAGIVTVFSAGHYYYRVRTARSMAEAAAEEKDKKQ